MESILDIIKQRQRVKHKSVAVLIDPDKAAHTDTLIKVVDIANENFVDYFFVGGSHITNGELPKIINTLKLHSTIPVLLFPGSNMHIDDKADALLFLSLISGRNPELLIGQHVAAAHRLKKSDLEIIPTGYILIDGGVTTSVVYMSNTMPIPSNKYSIAASTAMAGEMLGHQLIYMDAGSGAKIPIGKEMIATVKKSIDVPLVIGGGIRTVESALQALNAGGDIIVIGNAAEKNPNLLIEVSNAVYDLNKSLDVH